jgi:BirA family biotin operon repressor/biotin-[acetyl-CoA-carboxylase] ligase
MQWAKQHLYDAPDGAVFLADTLTHAHGRQGRTWELMRGQLCITLILKPKNFHTIKSENFALRLNQLNMAVTHGIQEPLQTIGVGLKWPNDFIVRNKKVGGLIMELVWHNDQLQGIIVGFALNVNNEFEETNALYQTATSLKMVCGKELDLMQLREQLFESIDQWYDKWCDGAYHKIYQAWLSEQVYLGKLLTLHRKDGTQTSGIMKKILENGDLVLVHEDGTEEIISFYLVDEVKI